ncbi:MAG: MFS transporter, partial [Acidobacteriaceae bacterium]|nr:MFS transporter [Acidobacteriaceae bacterium]
MIFRVQKDFAKLWAGQTVSEVCSRITREGLPLTALLTLHANAAQMGVLSAISSAAVLVFGLGAGVLVDRWKKRPVMIAADLGRAGLLGLVPLAAFMHVLSITALMVIAALAGTLTVLFDVAYQSYLPVLVEQQELLESNRRLSISSSGAEMLGPALAGVLVQAITAPVAILLDALSFVVSALSLWSIRKREITPERK